MTMLILNTIRGMSIQVYLDNKIIQATLLNCHLIEKLQSDYYASILFGFPEAIQDKEYLHKALTLDFTYRSMKDHVSGVITHINKIKRHAFLYELRIEPYFCMLDKTKHSRTFVNQSAITIIHLIIKKHPKLSIDFSYCHKKQDPIAYTVQYKETDYQFLKRIMSEQGISYYFRNDKMILYDDIAGYEAYEIPQRKPIISRRASQLIPDKITLLSQNKLSATTNDSAHQLIQHIYPILSETPQQQEDELKLAVNRVKQTQNILFMHSDYLGLHIGSTFFNGNYYVIKEVYHMLYQINGAIVYTNQCYAIPVENMLCLPHYPRPTVDHELSATVTAIETSTLARVKVSYPWDENNTPSIYIPVRQYWANANYGAQFLPKKGDKVFIEYLEGDLAKPIITGYQASPYNGIKIGESNNFMAMNQEGIFFNNEGEFAISADKSIAIESIGEVSLTVTQLQAKTIDIAAAQDITLLVGNSLLELKNGICRIESDLIELNPR
jgi:uncharacterized protein involved in type VI secretion and phage assembly